MVICKVRLVMLAFSATVADDPLNCTPVFTLMTVPETLTCLLVAPVEEQTTLPEKLPVEAPESRTSTTLFTVGAGNDTLLAKLPTPFSRTWKPEGAVTTNGADKALPVVVNVWLVEGVPNCVLKAASEVTEAVMLGNCTTVPLKVKLLILKVPVAPLAPQP